MLKFSHLCIPITSQKIITNDSVVEMVRKAVMEEIETNESKYEPKMTRAKLKEFEAQGQVSFTL